MVPMGPQKYQKLLFKYPVRDVISVVNNLNKLLPSPVGTVYSKFYIIK